MASLTGLSKDVCSRCGWPPEARVTNVDETAAAMRRRPRTRGTTRRTTRGGCGRGRSTPTPRPSPRAPTPWTWTRTRRRCCRRRAPGWPTPSAQPPAGRNILLPDALQNGMGVPAAEALMLSEAKARLANTKCAADCRGRHNACTPRHAAEQESLLLSRGCCCFQGSCQAELGTR